jgi:hypothetical protein
MEGKREDKDDRRVSGDRGEEVASLTATMQREGWR